MAFIDVAARSMSSLFMMGGGVELICIFIGMGLNAGVLVIGALGRSITKTLYNYVPFEKSLFTYFRVFFQSGV